MRVERLDRAQRQERTEAERQIRRAPDFGAGRIDRERKALAAECLRPGDGVPSRRRPATVRIGPAGRGGHVAALEFDAVFVAYAIERRQHIGGKSSGFLKHRGGDVGVEIAVMLGFDGSFQTRAMIEGQQHVINRGAVGHDGVSLSREQSLSYSHETSVVSTLQCRKGPRETGRPRRLPLKGRVNSPP